MKKILVTGGSGFLGSRICRHFSNEYRIIAPAHKDMELADSESIMEIFEKNVPDIVIHSAAISDVRACEDNAGYSYGINVAGTENIARACEKYRSKLILCSSDQIYFGSNQSRAHKENEEESPVNQYGRQKREAEKICLTYCKDAVALRLSWMYDYRQLTSGEHGDFLRNLINALNQNIPISYPIYDFRGITYVQTVINNIEKSFMLPGGVYNFGSENERNTFETVRRLMDALGLDASRITADDQSFAANPRNIRMNIDKIREHAILFPDTLEGLVECISLHRDEMVGAK